MFFHFLVLFFIYLFRSLQFSSRGSFTSLVRFIQRYFIIFDARVNWTVSTISFSVWWLLIYRKTTGFKITLYPAPLMKLLIVSRSFLVELLGSYMYCIKWYTYRYNLTSPFPICVPLIAFSCLIALASAFSMISERSGNSEKRCLIPDFNRMSVKFSFFFSFRIMMLGVCKI